MKPIGTPLVSGSSGVNGWPGGGCALRSKNAKVRPRSRENSSGPSDQYTVQLSPDQCRFQPVSRETRAVG